MRPEAGKDRCPRRVLIVDDHEISRAAFSALLRTEGLEVADARAGDEAIAAATTFRPCVVIVDVAPAAPTGFTIARRLQALPGAPAVLLTSSAHPSRFGSMLGRNRFIAKADLCAHAIAELTPACT